MVKEKGHKPVAQNKKARHDYLIEDTWEAGISLMGTEVKSLRQGRASLVDGFAEVENGEVWLLGVHIPEYSQGTWTNHAARRRRKLLLNRHEIDKIEKKVADKGYTLVPLSLYFKDGRAKVELALAKGKKAYDKRHALAERQANREKVEAVQRRRAYPLERAEFIILRQLAEAGPQSVGALARALLLDDSTMTRQVAALEQKGLAERRPDPTDRRAGLIAVTPPGEKAMREMRILRAARISRYVAGWTDAERRMLGTLLARLNATLIEELSG